MGDDDSRTSLHKVIQGTLHKALALGIQCRSGFVEDENRGILVDGTGDREALALTPGELTPAVPDIGVIACRHLIDELIGVRDLGGLTHLLEGSTLDTEGDILKDRSIEEDGLLIDVPHEAAQISYRDLTDIRAIDGDAPLNDVVEARDEVHERALPRARMPDECDGLPLADRQIYVT